MGLYRPVAGTRLTQLPQGATEEQEVPVVTQPQQERGPISCSLPVALRGPVVHPGPPQLL